MNIVFVDDIEIVCTSPSVEVAEEEIGGDAGARQRHNPIWDDYE